MEYFVGLMQKRHNSSVSAMELHLLHEASDLEPGLLRSFHVKILVTLLVNKDFQTWHLIGWQQSCQPIRCHVRKSLLINMEFNMDFT